MAPGMSYRESSVVSQHIQPTPQPEEATEREPTPPVTGEPTGVVTTDSPVVPVPEDESTIGTGTSMALGCIAGTVLLIIFGLLFLAVSTLV